MHSYPLMNFILLKCKKVKGQTSFFFHRDLRSNVMCPRLSEIQSSILGILQPLFYAVLLMSYELSSRSIWTRHQQCLLDTCPRGHNDCLSLWKCLHFRSGKFSLIVLLITSSSLELLLFRCRSVWICSLISSYLFSPIFLLFFILFFLPFF